MGVMSLRSTRTATVAMAVAALLMTGACTNTDEGGTDSDTERIELIDSATASFVVTGSVNQVFVSDAKPEEELLLVDADGAVVDTATTDDQGSLIYRLVDEGDNMRVVSAQDNTVQSETVDVLDADESQPVQSFYDNQTLTEGFHYITTRDGTTLSAAVYLPPGDGPFPTVVEYSGYDPSDPTQNLRGTVEDLGLNPDDLCSTIKIICAKPAQPSSLLAAAAGYAVVAVNVRGTGCSGGAYDFFEPLQLLDGYDVIETVAAQEWVRGKVGMVGLSYPGISQLFVASTNPPNLAAITPMSVFHDTARGVLSPGGIYNEGFALSWADNVLDDAVAFGQGWTETVTEGGDTTCAANQRFRGQNVDATKKALANQYYTDDVAMPLDPSTFVDRIDVPVFMTGSWQDEQTGPSFSRLWDRFTKAPVTKFMAMNGAHGDGYSPETYAELKMFLDFYVAGQRTPLPDFLRSLGPSLLADTFGVTVQYPPERLIDGEFDDLRAQYEAEPDVTVLWDRGGDPSNLGAPESLGRTQFDTWADRDVAAQRWFLGPGGRLDDATPTASGGFTSFNTDLARAQRTTLPGDRIDEAFDALPTYDWVQDSEGAAAAFQTEPLERDTVILGGGSADLWIRADGEEAHVGVTLSEVRPDGTEVFIQVGQLKASRRAPGPNATEFDPDHTLRREDVEALKPGEWTEARVEIFPVGHVLRAGARLKLSVHTPGGDQARWAWIIDDTEPASIDIGTDAAHPSSIVLPIGNAVTGYRPEFPACPGLRAQPCRAAQAFTNTDRNGD